MLWGSPGRYLEAFWSPDKAVLDLWEALGRASWRLFGASWRLLGASWRLLGASWGTSGRNLDDLGAFGRLLVPLGGVLGGSWEALGSIPCAAHVPPRCKGVDECWGARRVSCSNSSETRRKFKRNTQEYDIPGTTCVCHAP